MDPKTEDVQGVKTLKVPAVDKSHEFAGLSKLKMQKKERHMKALREFAKFLEETNERVVQNVLSYSREFRETMEVLDDELQKFCDAINEDGYLLPKSEQDLIDMLEDTLKVKIQNRSDIVERFAYDLDHTETDRAESTGAELKRLVDQLIAIAHQLPDDIEHIVEAEAYELNMEIIKNKNVHAQTVAAHQITQVKIEAECLQKWEDCRAKWRQLRHEKALNDFRTHISSPEFTDPQDRQFFMKRVRAGQENRWKATNSCFEQLKELTCRSITSETVTNVQAELGEINVQEIGAIQTCYDDLIRLKSDTAYRAADRVEALRRELHVYGALKIEPNLRKNANVLQSALDDEALTELWRLGGGLKPEFQAQVADLCHEDVIYDRMIVGMQSRLELVVSSFTLKSVLEERGRLSQLEKVRGLIVKMRTTPRHEVAGVLRSLLPDLGDVQEIEQLPALFKEQVLEVVNEINEELVAVDQRQAAISAANATGGLPPGTASMSGTSALNATGTHKTAALGATAAAAASGSVAPPTAPPGSATLKSTTAGLGTTKGKTGRMSATGATERGGGGGDGIVLPAAHADPTLVKGWNRRLGILYFGSDLPVAYQQGCLESLELVREQQECNTLVDAVVLDESENKLRKLEKKYKALIDEITTYLETQAGMISQAATNIGDFFLKIAKMVEEHRKAQKALDDKSADEIWDLKEEFRFEKEDREAAYEAACQKIRESTKQDELQSHFEEVLNVLEGIQTSYRVYHSNACFANDRYPLMLSHEFRDYLNKLSANFFLEPEATHAIITEYERIFDQTIRFNKKYFDENPLAGGVDRLPLPAVEPPLPSDLLLDPTAAGDGDRSVDGGSVAGDASAADGGHIAGDNHDHASAGGDDAGSIGSAAHSTTGRQRRGAGGSATAEDDGASVGMQESSAVQPIPFPSPHAVMDPIPENVCTGSFYWTTTVDGVAAKFKNEDGCFAAPEPAVPPASAPGGEGGEGDAAVAASAEGGIEGAGAAAGVGGDAAAAAGGGDGEEGATDPGVTSLLAHLKEPHEQCPYVTANCPVLPVASLDLLEQMDADDLEEYEVAIAKHFLDLGDASDIPEVPEEPIKPKKGAPVEEVPEHPLSKLTPEQLEIYTKTKEMAIRVKARLEERAEAAYILSHPPLDPHGKTWIMVLEIMPDVIQMMVGGIRDSIIVSLEREVYKRLAFSERQSEQTKADLTDQLEDQIRNHWPRRGRVETQIKQPREAELLGHKEKTWRHISAIQQKMIVAQETFDFSLQAGRAECDAYVNDMTAQRNSLSGNFKNLAFLQAIDVKARGITLSFNTATVARVAVLSQIAQEETDSISFFARDFRKICPPQVPGVEGGYSESEILEIEALVEAQCEEIDAVSAEWKEAINQLEEEQVQSLRCQEEFSEKYKKCTQDVAMSEGLGQKYGAPRRRAQERIRTEVGRDERCAGKLDELLAKLEFACSEAEQAAQNRLAFASSIGSTTLAASLPQKPEVSSPEVSAEEEAMDGRNVGVEELYQCTLNWNLLRSVRLTLQQRVKYLRVAGDAGLPECANNLPWLDGDRIALSAELGPDTGDSDLAALQEEEPESTLEEVLADVDQVCRKETRELYESEGLGSVLGEGGVPDSLQQWLAESKDKMLGRHGHREKAWKRLWAQVARSEDILARHLIAKEQVDSTRPNETNEAGADSKYTTKLGVPAICLRSLVASFVDFARQDKEMKIAEFSKLLKVWEKGREKHERLLRPRLGSPDLADELNELDKIESQRSGELVEHVEKFRTMLVRSQTTHLMRFLEDLAKCGKGLIQMLDSTLRQELLQVPPDTAIPKKHMTLKKLRKAQRVREMVAQGGEDQSQRRSWPGIQPQSVVELIRAAEDLVLDLGSDPSDTANPAAAAAATPADAKGKKAAKGAPPPEPEGPPTLISDGWAQKLQEESAVEGLVSTAHRIVVSERDATVKSFSQYIANSFEDIRADYDLILQQESSWMERWNRQVEMLRKGNV